MRENMDFPGQIPLQGLLQASWASCEHTQTSPSQMLILSKPVEMPVEGAYFHFIVFLLLLFSNIVYLFPNSPISYLILMCASFWILSQAIWSQKVRSEYDIGSGWIWYEFNSVSLHRDSAFNVAIWGVRKGSFVWLGGWNMWWEVPHKEQIRKAIPTWVYYRGRDSWLRGSGFVIWDLLTHIERS